MTAAPSSPVTDAIVYLDSSALLKLIFEEPESAALAAFLADWPSRKLVEEFILDYTLTPAIATFGLEGLRGIDPTCGSGHFLLGMFHRLQHAWEQQLGPGVPVKEAVRRAMGSIYGIDLNPFAVAISRFRLMIAGLHACGYTRMKDCPD